MADVKSPRKSLEGKLSKSEKKQARKEAKSRHTLLRHEGIHTSKIPTKHLIVGNGGLGNGVSRNDLKSLFSQYGQLTDIVMLPGKPYSVVCYATIQEAATAHDRLQAWQLRPPNGPSTAVILYLSFINEVPHAKMAGTQHSLPPGLILIEDFIGAQVEEDLMQDTLWDQQDESQDSAKQTLKHRRVRHFGYEFNYATNNVDKECPLPEPMPLMLVDVIDRIMKTGLVENRPDQITVNEYQPGQGIPPHVDTHSAFQDAIISLSLGSQVLMEFSNPISGCHVPVFLPRRSLLIMTGEARYLWSHGITPRKSDIIPAHIDPTNGSAASDDISVNTEGLTLMHREVRRSFTFRAIRGSPCHCAYPSCCDSQRDNANPQPTGPTPPTLPTTDLQAMQLEVTHVHRVYESIAGHFSQTRHKPWPRVVTFLQDLEPGSILLDVGCGNGKYLDGNPTVFSIGCDRSVKLVEICKQRRFQAFSCDGLNLPVRSGSIDACICIAVIHHFSTQNRRLAAIKEISRVLRPGGLGLIYVWAKEQERGQKKSHYISNTAQRNAGRTGSGGKEKETEGRQEDSDQDCAESNKCLVKDTVESQCYNECNSSYTASSVNGLPSIASVSTNATTQTGSSNRDTESDITGGHCNQEDTSTIPEPTLPSNKAANAASCQTDEQSLEGNPSSRKQDHANKTLAIHTNRTEFESQDLLVPWHLKDKDRTPLQGNGAAGEEDEPVYHRFYHVFQEGELEGLCRRVEGVDIQSSHYDQGNWGVVIRKT